MFFHQIWEVSGHYFLKNYFCLFLSFLDPHYDYIAGLMVSYKSVRLCSFFSILLLFCSSDKIISIELFSSIPILSSDSSNLLNYLFQLLYFSTVGFCLVHFVFKIICLFISIFFKWKHIILIPTFHSLDMVPLSWNIFNRADLKSLPSKSSIWSSGTVSIHCFFSTWLFHFSCKFSWYYRNSSL